MAIISRAILGLALPCLTGLATAASPLGSAVAGAPSLFVLAVVESRADKAETKAAAQEPRQDPSAQAPERTRQGAAQAGQEARTSERDLADDRKLTQR